MSNALRFFISVVVTFCALGCGGPSLQEPDVPDGRKPRYDDSVYCFNERWIVRSGSKFGLVDKHQKLIIPIEYQDIVFLRDDIALLQGYGTLSLSDTTGWVFCENTDKDYLINSFSEIYDSKVKDNLLLWDRILDSYDDLCNKCIDARIDNVSYATVVELLNSIKGNIGNIPLKMSQEQLLRFEGIKERYNSCFK